MYNPVVEKRRIADEDQELSVFVQLKKKKKGGDWSWKFILKQQKSKDQLRISFDHIKYWWMNRESDIVGGAFLQCSDARWVSTSQNITELTS